METPLYHGIYIIQLFTCYEFLIIHGMVASHAPLRCKYSIKINTWNRAKQYDQVHKTNLNHDLSSMITSRLELNYYSLHNNIDISVFPHEIPFPSKSTLKFEEFSRLARRYDK